jgi:hypothetical protein
VRAIIDLCSTLHWMQRFWGLVSKPYLIGLRQSSPSSVQNPNRPGRERYGMISEVEYSCLGVESVVYLFRLAVQLITTDIGVNAAFSCVLIKNL